MAIVAGIPQLTTLTFDESAVDVTSDGRVYTISSDGRTYRLELVEASDGWYDLSIDGRQVRAYVSSDGQTRWVSIHGRTVRLTRKLPSARAAAAGHEGSSELMAPMPGQVRAVNVQAGDAVTRGQVLLVLEAMKMEIRLQAPFDAQIASVDASVGQTVEREQVLVRLRRPPRSEP